MDPSMRFRVTLNKVGLRATNARLQLLDVLEQSHSPLSVEECHTKLSVDLATIYRTLRSLCARGLVREIRFKDALARYELSASGHHHHVVCTKCGSIEELADCPESEVEKLLLNTSSRFARITDHSLEFFGICTVCA